MPSAEPHKRARRHPKNKTAYRVRNWPVYDQALRERGDVTVWLNEATIAAWRSPPSGRRGGQQKYSDMAIQTALTLRLLFHLPLRQTEGFLSSIFRLSGLDLPVPDHTTLSRRNQTLKVKFPQHTLPAGPITLIIDSTGLKICGQGEWHCKKHGEKYRRKWKKLHIGEDETGWIHTTALTDGHTQDPTVVPKLLESVDGPLHRFVADGMYDNATVYDALADHQDGAAIDIVVPPRRNAAPSQTAQNAPTQRDQHIAAIQDVGIFEWRRTSGYYTQSQVENVFSRYKTVIGGHLRAKRADSQQREAQQGCAILNRLRQLGEPASVPIT